MYIIKNIDYDTITCMLALNELIWCMQKNDKIIILTQQFMPLMGNKS